MAEEVAIMSLFESNSDLTCYILIAHNLWSGIRTTFPYILFSISIRFCFVFIFFSELNLAYVKQEQFQSSLSFFYPLADHQATKSSRKIISWYFLRLPRGSLDISGILDKGCPASHFTLIPISIICI